LKDKFPLKIISNGQKDNFKASTSLDRLHAGNTNTRKDLAYLEQDYSILIRSVRSLIDIYSEHKRSDPRLYWLVGDYILKFLDRIDDLGFYLVQQNRTIAQHLGLSESSIKKIISFRRRFKKISFVHPSIPWNKYRDNKVPLPNEKG